MSSADHTAVMFPVKCGGPKVNQLDPGVSHSSDISLVGRTILCTPVIGHKQNIFWLQICVGQVIVVKKLKMERFLFR